MTKKTETPDVEPKQDGDAAEIGSDLEKALHAITEPPPPQDTDYIARRAKRYGYAR